VSGNNDSAGDDTARWLAARAADLMPQAAALRDSGHGAVITVSRKVFIPLTRLCRDSWQSLGCQGSCASLVMAIRTRLIWLYRIGKGGKVGELEWWEGDRG
jgi:hypothetical protein